MTVRAVAKQLMRGLGESGALPPRWQKQNGLAETVDRVIRR